MVFDPNDDGRDFDAEEWPFFWLTRATGLYLSQLEKHLKSVGLDVPRWRVLMCIRPDEASGISRIAELAIVKLPTMMKLVQRMEAEGLVSSAARIGDGRFTDVSLTDRGLAARTLAWRTAGQIFTRVFADVPQTDRDRLNASLRLLVEHLERTGP